MLSWAHDGRLVTEHESIRSRCCCRRCCCRRCCCCTLYFIYLLAGLRCSLPPFLPRAFASSFFVHSFSLVTEWPPLVLIFLYLSITVLATTAAFSFFQFSFSLSPFLPSSFFPFFLLCSLWSKKSCCLFLHVRVVVCVRAWAARKEISLCFAQRIKEDEENSIPEECRGRGRGKNSTSAPNAVKIKETERPYTFISSLLTIGVISKSN